ncbi:spermine oxidase-like [Eupeodes corollae]|uniref:spermine oxidase-like n=1 Tax=Eupeodes corollae TaxID=290404 RepID=UPI00248FD4F4|nr:spermine oxidase-like [Eupeodes corollae]
MNTSRVAIIGTGPSGIAAATKLLELGFQKVTLIEAENRIGGRIHTIPFADNVVDLGAQWCHGQKNNVVYELASKEENLLEHSGEDFDKFDCIRSNKDVVAEKTIDRLKTIFESIMKKGEKELLTYDGSVGKYVTNEFFEALKQPENSDIDVTIAKEMFESFKKMENSLNACDSIDELSSKGFMDYYDCEGDLYMNWKDKGYIQFLRLLMKSTEGNELGILDQKVKLGKQVQKITWNQDNGQQAIQIQCKDNEVIEADHVIVTVSLGVLKEKHSKLFDPKLPVEKIRAIESIGFGTVNKIYMEFATQFWPNDWNGFNSLWREDDLNDIRGSSQAWFEDVIGFYPVTHQPKILCGWMVSSNARHMETLSEDEVIRRCLEFLRKFLLWDIPAPVNFKRTTWYSNENFRGSYSFQSVKAEESKAKPIDLARPLEDEDKKPLVLFAGEATSEHHFSTVQGAVESGWREAKRLAEFYNIKAE